MKLIQKIIAIIEKETDKKIDIKKNFTENKMDSLDMMSIIMAVENSFKCKISDKVLKKINKVEDIEKFLIKNSKI